MAQQQIEPLTALRAIRDSRTLDCIQRMVLVALVLRADESWNCYPSLATLAADAGIAKSTLQTTLRGLRDAGLLQWKPVFDAGNRRHKANTYKLVTGAILALGVYREPAYTGSRHIPPGGTGVYREPVGGIPGAGNDLPIELPIENCPEEKMSAEPPTLVLEPPVGKGSGGRKKQDPSTAIVDAVLACWAKNKTLFPKREPKVTDAYRTIVRKRLADGYTQADLEAAIDGCAKSAFHVERGYKSPELIFRDGKIEQFVAWGRGEADPNRSGGVAKSAGPKKQPVGLEEPSWLQNA